MPTKYERNEQMTKSERVDLQTSTIIILYNDYEKVFNSLFFYAVNEEKKHNWKTCYTLWSRNNNFTYCLHKSLFLFDIIVSLNLKLSINLTKNNSL